MNIQSDPRLEEFLHCHGQSFEGGANKPVRLDNPDTIWYVESGALDVFIVEDQEEGATSRLKHMLRAGPGRVIFGIEKSTKHTLTAFGKGTPGSILHFLPLEKLLQADFSDDLATQVDHWITELTAAVVRDIPTFHFPNTTLIPGDCIDLDSGDTISSRIGVVWAKLSTQMSSFLDTEEPDQSASNWLALTPQSWLTSFTPGSVESTDSQTLLCDAQLFQSLANFHHLLLCAERTNQALAQADLANQEVVRENYSQLDKASALQNLYATLSSKPAASNTTQSSALVTALTEIGNHEGILFDTSVRRQGQDDSGTSLNEILLASGVNRRAVHLDIEERWWRGNSGAMLAFRKNDGGCVALVPNLRGRYRIFDPETGRSEVCSKETTLALESRAWLFYRPLPNNRKIGPWKMLRFATYGQSSIFARFITAGLLASILTLAPAVAIEHIVNELVPTRFESALLMIVVVLIMAAVAGSLLQMLQGTALMYIEGQAAARTTSAVWSRLFALPSAFFKRFTAGDLMIRAMAIQSLRDKISGVVANSVLSLVFLIPAIFLMFFYDSLLGWITLAIGVGTITIAVVLGMLQTNPQRREFMASRKLTSNLLTFINGIHKLRLNHAENHAFASWARNYRKQKLAELDSGRLSNYFIALSTAIPVLASCVIFTVAIYRGPENITVGDFLAVFAILMIFCTAILRFGLSLEAIAAIVPSFEQIKPILQVSPEILETANPSYELQGRIHFDQISFRYSEDSPLVLDHVSIHAEPGEFIAIVGESGAGKTTLLQLALGLEKPLTGAVYYDTRDLAYLNFRAVRQQIGLVLQNGVLMPGNILENIIGSLSDLTTEDAWRAAKFAAIDAEISAMPMGLFTILGDNENIISGGQAQRIQIAAAFAKKPRIFILDEATNWLDTENQAKVIESLENMVATRIVIAHRLSTIRKADRIYVLQSGKIVQVGKFDELYNSEGYFRQLMLRQTL